MADKGIKFHKVNVFENFKYLCQLNTKFEFRIQIQIKGKKQLRSNNAHCQHHKYHHHHNQWVKKQHQGQEHHLNNQDHQLNKQDH